MGEIYRLSNKVQNYDWGSCTMLAGMRGESAPSEQPEAEVWVGAHPSAPCIVHLPTGDIPLNEWVDRAPEDVLPAGWERDFFPFLFKILAIDAPLSIQVHPSDEQAEAGFAAENNAGVKLDDPARNYKDPHSKPETLIALTEVHALTGVRPADELQRIAERLGLTWLSELLPASSDKQLLESVLRLEDAAAEQAVRQTVERAARAAEQTDLDECLQKLTGVIAEIHQKHPGDRGLLVATVMNLVHLKPGDSAHTPDGQVHAYVSGCAVEIMNPSDNVMRAGLTSKHIDIDELISILADSQPAPQIEGPTPAEGPLGRYRMWDDRLSVTRVRATGEPVELTLAGTSAVLATEGELVFDAGQQRFEVQPTESLLHVGSETAVTVTGTGEAFIAAYV